MALIFYRPNTKIIIVYNTYDTMIIENIFHGV